MDATMKIISSIANDYFQPALSLPIIITLILYYYFTWTFDYWSKLGVNYVKPTIIFGNYSDLLLFRKSLPETVKSMYDKFPEDRFTGFYRVRSPILLIRDPNLIKQILVKNFACFVNRGIPINRDDPLSGHLFNLENEQWRSLRTKLAPVFTSSKIKRMYHLLNDCHENFRKSIDENSSFDEIMTNNNDRTKTSIDVRELTQKFTIDVIGTCAFGININSLKNDDSSFRKMSMRLSKPCYKTILWRFLRTALPNLYKFFGVRVIDSEVTIFFINVVKRMIAQRESEIGPKRRDFMDLLVELKHKRDIGDCDRDEENHHEAFEDDGKRVKEFELDDNAIAAQAFVFFVAGNETSSNTIAFCLHELAINENIQRKARREIHDEIDKANGTLTYEAVQRMKYLDMIIMETLRKYPPAPLVSRICAYPWKIPETDVELPAGMRVVIPIYGIHHDSNYYPKPDKFDPERFSDGTRTTEHRYTYLPFGEGPRNCIGMRFAMLQTKIGIISFLRDHRLEICEKTAIPIKFSKRSLVTSSEGGFWLRIIKNHSTI